MSSHPLTVTVCSNVTRVDFFKGPVQIGQALSPPYAHSAALTHLDNGEIRFRAAMVGKQGETREASFVIDVAIGKPDITAPVPMLTASARLEKDFMAAVSSTLTLDIFGLHTL